MALRAHTPIVPISICELAQWHPKGSLLPLDVPKGVRVIVHPPIHVAGQGFEEGELCDRVYAIVNSALPTWQQGPARVTSRDGLTARDGVRPADDDDTLDERVVDAVGWR